MHRQVFRQASSPAGQAPSSATSDATPSTTTTPVRSTESQTPSETPTTSFSTSPTSSESAAPTTSPSASSTEPTSTSSPAPASPSSTTSHANTPTSTPESSTTSDTSFSIPSSSFSTTTPPPTSSSSQQGTPTTITSAYTTYIDGSQVVTSTAVPSTIPDLSSPSSLSSNRTAIIAGSAAGGTALLILFLSLAFYFRRKRFKHLDFLDAITLKRRRTRFLDGEDLDDVTPPTLPYTDYETPWERTPTHRRTASGTDTGSAFREDVWPPPHESTRLMDPNADVSIGPDLSRIMDQVMGPSPAAAHYSDRSVSSMYRGSVAESEGQALLHSRTVSNASHAALLEAAGLGAPTTPNTPNTPARPSPLTEGVGEEQGTTSEHAGQAS